MKTTPKKERVIHMWPHRGRHYVQSECNLRYPKVHGIDLTTDPSQATCVACLMARRKINTREATGCTNQIARLIDVAQTKITFNG